jgi:hypothetical protein
MIVAAFAPIRDSQFLGCGPRASLPDAFDAAWIAMRRFTSKVAYYERARAPYGVAFFAVTSELFIQP